jgi:acyl-CoA synthetase (AMP-forming)/AMP-acid ligase II
MFFHQLDRFGDKPALIDAETGIAISYQDLENLIQQRCEQLTTIRQLVFIEATNSIPWLVTYLACLRQQYVVYLLETLEDDKTQALIDTYQPNLIITANQEIKIINENPYDLHQDLVLLLSTSGSTGTPKFVKLSAKNIQSNAESIAEYLLLDSSERAYAHLKPFYSYGLSVIHSHLVVGAALILTSRSITEPEFLHQLKQYQASSFAGVPYTFETLLRLKFDISQYPQLRYMTQAGGKLVSHLVVDYVKRCAAENRRFIVMYGQTEAAPRISYLPAEFAGKYPESIGTAIPGGELFLVDENKETITEIDKPGELAYRGPNVMMGYAISPEQLATDETPDCLYTGDIACINADGLFYIVGRTSRFVKMFGLRINLDQIQSDLKLYYSNIAVTGNDQRILIVLSQEEATHSSGLISQLAHRYHLPEICFRLSVYPEIPLLPNGKYHYKKMLADMDNPQQLNWFTRFTRKVSDLLELNDRQWLSISDLYRTLLSNPNITDEDSFDSLEADSLSYVTLAIEMEAALSGALPADWRSLPLSKLDSLYLSRRVAA